MKAAGAVASRKRTRNALAQVVYEGVCREITHGRMKPGQLLSRRQIARRYGCSYTTVVEAMKQLEGARLVEAESAQMARVRQVTRESIRDLYVLQEAYETQAIRMACVHVTDEEVRELYSLAGALDRRISLRKSADPQGQLLHWQFHKRIAQLSRSAALMRELGRSAVLASIQTTWLITTTVTDDLPRWHSILVDALKSRDPMKADAAMRAHTRRGLEKELMAYERKLCE